MSDSVVDEEVWLPIPGLEARYEVSNYGNVKALAREVHLLRDGKPIIRFKRERAITPVIDKDGYARFALHINATDRSKFYGHRLVMMAFCGPCPPNMQVCHNDGNPINNNVSNLRYDTQINNDRDKLRHGTMLFGEQHPKSKLTDSDVASARRARARGESMKNLAEQYGVTLSTICKAMHGSCWAHIDEPTTEPEMVKLVTVDECAEMRRRAANGESHSSIAVDMGFSQTTVSRYVSGARVPKASRSKLIEACNG